MSFSGSVRTQPRGRQASSTVSQVLCRHSHVLWTHRIYPLPVPDVNLTLLPSGITSVLPTNLPWRNPQKIQAHRVSFDGPCLMFDPLAKGIARSVGTGRRGNHRGGLCSLIGLARFRIQILPECACLHDRVSCPNTFLIRFASNCSTFKELWRQSPALPNMPISTAPERYPP